MDGHLRYVENGIEFDIIFQKNRQTPAPRAVLSRQNITRNTQKHYETDTYPQCQNH